MAGAAGQGGSVGCSFVQLMFLFRWWCLGEGEAAPSLGFRFGTAWAVPAWVGRGCVGSGAGSAPDISLPSPGQGVHLRGSVIKPKTDTGERSSDGAVRN